MNLKTVHFNKIDYFTTFIVIGFSGISFFTQSQPLFLFFTVVFFILFVTRKTKLDPSLFIILIAQLLISLLQYILVGNFNFNSFIGNLLIWIFPYFYFRSLKSDFFQMFVRIMYTLSLISLVLWLILIFYPYLNNILKELSYNLRLDPASNESLIFYNVEGHRLFGFSFRNAGPFNESGVFGLFLTLALIFNIINESLELIWNKRNIVFIISMLTTGSTGSYLALGAMFILYFLFYKRSYLSIILVPVFFGLGYFAYYNIEFLGEKIEKQYETQQNTKRLYNRGRLGTALADWDQIKDYPVSGLAIYKENRYYDYTDKINDRAGGLMGIPNLFVRYGIPFGLFYLVFQFLSIRYLALRAGYENWLIPMSGFILIQITWLGQSPSLKPVYIILVYYAAHQIIYFKKNRKLRRVRYA